MPSIRRLAERHGWKLGLSRFVAGATLREALAAIARLEGDGFTTILDLLGESVTSEAGARAMHAGLVGAVGAVSEIHYPGHVSLKPTQIGLAIDRDLALELARDLCLRAAAIGVTVTLDMEDHPNVDGTLHIYKTLRAEGLSNVCAVLQSYLRRTPADLESLLPLAPTIRLVKGAYSEPPRVAHTRAPVMNRAFLDLTFRLLDGGGRAQVATHDERLVREVERRVDERGIGPDRVEYQFLYGVRRDLQRRLVGAGRRVRIYVPYGADWYAYYSRRIAERPANLAFALRSLIG
ncbi:MAG: proline dehydrogenase family protein [Myxococcota bacterium]|nr:proline dehydrogenase family protein [Myxococcota bacterium]